MVQTQFGSIGQLIKGCCLTDRPVTLLLSILVLLMTIQVITACQCQYIDWERFMRPEEKKTVVMAVEKSNQVWEKVYGSPMGTLHRMVTEKVFKEGTINLTMIDHTREFWMITPQNCRASLTKDEFYIIYGTAGVRGELYATKCTIEPFDRDFFKKSGRENLLEVLWGERGRN